MDLLLRKAFISNPKNKRDSSLQIMGRGCEENLLNSYFKRRVSGVIVIRTTR